MEDRTKKAIVLDTEADTLSAKCSGMVATTFEPVGLNHIQLLIEFVGLVRIQLSNPPPQRNGAPRTSWQIRLRASCAIRGMTAFPMPLSRLRSPSTSRSRNQLCRGTLALPRGFQTALDRDAICSAVKGWKPACQPMSNTICVNNGFQIASNN